MKHHHNIIGVSVYLTNIYHAINHDDLFYFSSIFDDHKRSIGCTISMYYDFVYIHCPIRCLNYYYKFNEMISKVYE